MITAPCKLLASTFLTLSCFAMAAADLGSNITVSGWVIDSAGAYTKEMLSKHSGSGLCPDDAQTAPYRLSPGPNRSGGIDELPTIHS
jgi:hypothetical protein